MRAVAGPSPGAGCGMTDLKQQDETALSQSRQPGAGDHGNGNGHGGAIQRVPAAPPSSPARTPTPEEIVDSLRFMFAVGIECSNPTIAGNHRVDELESTGHYDNWRKDLRLVRG